MNLFRKLLFLGIKTASPAEQFLVSPEFALKELEQRRKDPALIRKVEDYLHNDIPDYFREKPIFYLARHIATPNFETLRFLELSKQFRVNHVIGQDSNDCFTSSNPLKRALGKMSIATSHHGRRGEGFSYFTVIDFNSAQKKKLSSLCTICGESLMSFHNNLFEITNPGEIIQLRDDAAWIDRNYRNNLLEHYKRQLALFIVHGVLFEFYEDDEIDFVERILKPAYEEIYKTFGVKPLICNLVPKKIEHLHDWEAYPRTLLHYLQARLYGMTGKKRKVREHVAQTPALA